MRKLLLISALVLISTNAFAQAKSPTRQSPRLGGAGDGATSVKLTSDKNPAIAGEFVAFTAHLVWSGAVRPTGVIQIKEGTQVLAELTPVSDEPPAPRRSRLREARFGGRRQVGGGATWHTNILAPGIHKVRAFYLGDANYAPSASATYWQAICSCPLQITTVCLPDGVVGEPYEAQLEAVGGSPPYSWSIVDGVLPPGLSLASDGKITGTPTASGRWKLPGTQLALNVSPTRQSPPPAGDGAKPARTQEAKPRRR